MAADVVLSTSRTVIIPSDASTVLEVESDGAWSVDFN